MHVRKYEHCSFASVKSNSPPTHELAPPPPLPSVPTSEPAYSATPSSHAWAPCSLQYRQPATQSSIPSSNLRTTNIQTLNSTVPRRTASARSASDAPVKSTLRASVTPAIAAPSRAAVIQRSA